MRDACLNIGLDVQPFVYTPDELRAMLEHGNDLPETALAEGAVVYEASGG